MQNNLCFTCSVWEREDTGSRSWGDMRRLHWSPRLLKPADGEASRGWWEPKHGDTQKEHPEQGTLITVLISSGGRDLLSDYKERVNFIKFGKPLKDPQNKAEHVEWMNVGQWMSSPCEAFPVFRMHTSRLSGTQEQRRHGTNSMSKTDNNSAADRKIVTAKGKWVDILILTGLWVCLKS